MTAGERGAEMVEETVCIAEQHMGVLVNGGCKPFAQRPVRNCYEIYKEKEGDNKRE